MSTQKEFQEEIRKTFAKVKTHNKKYEIKIGNIKINVFPNVFSPAYFADSLWFAENLPKVVGKDSLLEIGTGTGIISLFCALNGASVTATDINLDAVKNAKFNFKKHKLKIKTYFGNLYRPLSKKDKFDFIFWNHPFNRGNNPNEEVLLKAGFDYNYGYLREYIKQAKNHLTKNGKLLLGTGNFADIKEIENIALANDYTLKILKRKKFPVRKGGKFWNELRIYEFEQIKNS